MGRPRRPWIKLLVDLDDHDKLARLPNDAARFGWVRVLLKAKTQRQMGTFASRRHLADILGRHGRYVDNYVAEGLAHEAPAMCRECRKWYPNSAPGQVVVHDYLREQRDPTHAERQAEYDGRVSDAKPDAKPAQNLTPNLTADSRARGMTVTVTETERREAPTAVAPPSPRSSPSSEPRLTERQLRSWDSFSSPRWQPFKNAWLARGLLYAPFGSDSDDDTSQRGLLWQIADARPNDLARWVREAPGRDAREVISHVLEKWHSVRTDAGVDDDEWEQQKREERRVAGGAMEKIGQVIGGPR
jgi:hypothetical protein